MQKPQKKLKSQITKLMCLMITIRHSLLGKCKSVSLEAHFLSMNYYLHCLETDSLAQDKRGIRKHKIVPVFSLRRFEDNFEDPKTPKGFSRGSMGIASVLSLIHI